MAALGIQVQLDLLETGEKLYLELKAHSSIQDTLRKNDKRMEGGFLCVAHILTGIPYLVAAFGEQTGEEANDRLAFAQEKVKRLASHETHELSRQSENKELKQYPGAIRTRELLLSFSGFPGHLDELFMILLAVRTARMSKAAARDLLTRFPNDYATKEVIEHFL